jgi:hypothetical protein
MKFEPIEPQELEKSFESRRGRVSYPIIKGFMETGQYAAKVNFEDPSRKPATMYILLKSYVANNDVPVKVLLRKNRVILVRLDINEKGDKIDNWKELNAPIEAADATADAVAIGDDIETIE